MMRGGDVIEIIGLFDDAGMTVWVDGGWGVDALVGEPTRPHDDLDLNIDIEHVDEAIAILSANGFELHLDQRPSSFVMRDANDRRVDFHPLRLDASGGWQVLLDGPDFLYPMDSLKGTGTIDGRTVRCISAEFQPYAHLGYEPDAGDFRDMYLPRDRLGIALPSPYDG